jgi:succinoglycan biosynthesis protein ExoA
MEDKPMTQDEKLLTADAGHVAPPARIRGSAQANLPFLCIAIPALNEAGYIKACLLSLLSQWPEDGLEILVMDGGSQDDTAQIVAEVAQSHPSVRLVTNPGRIQSAGVNLAATQASRRASILVRADAHCVYPADFLRRCVRDYLRTGATSVVVAMRNEAAPGHPLQRAIAAAQSSRLGNGGAAHRTGAVSGFVEHGHHAVFDLAFFRRIGGYDPSFTHNEDAEFDHRAVQAGGRIWMSREEPVVYFPRRSLDALARQYFNHGQGRARTLLKHRLRPKPRQMAPVMVLGGLAVSAAAAPFAPLLAAPALAYPLLCLAWGAGRAVAGRDAALLLSGAALMTMHMAWAVGFLKRVATPRPQHLPLASVQWKDIG